MHYTFYVTIHHYYWQLIWTALNDLNFESSYKNLPSLIDHLNQIVEHTILALMFSIDVITPDGNLDSGEINAYTHLNYSS